MKDKATPREITDQELDAVIDLAKNYHGFDFSEYSRASFKRRINRILQLKNISAFDLQAMLTNEAHFFQHFVDEVTVNVTEMFRDPLFFKSVEQHALPYLASYPHIKLWVAGCSTGEELYAYAVLLKMHKLYDRSFLYGTDINQNVLATAKQGIYSLQKLKHYSENFQAMGAAQSLADFYTAKYDAATLNRDLKKNVLFSMHNLITDAPFNEFQLISCRNVLIYFNAHLQAKVLSLLCQSLAPLGFLCLGSKESIRNVEIAKRFKIIDKKNNIYQKIS